MSRPAAMSRSSPFSYRCNACCRCCYRNQIQVNPYEVARLARNRGLSTTELIEEYLEPGKPYLRRRADGACVMLGERGCKVHPDRPLVCRLYPLGRRVQPDGSESFHQLTPDPKTAGEYGVAGTVADFLAQQGAQPFMEAGDRYQVLLYRLFDALRSEIEASPELGAQSYALYSDEEPASGGPPVSAWLDIDATLGAYCEEQGVREPQALEERMNLHITAIDQWLDTLEGETDENEKD